MLAGILASTRAALVRAQAQRPPAELAAAAAGAPAAPRFGDALKDPAIAVIAEFKRRSPSAGAFLSDPAAATARTFGGSARL